MKYIFLIIFSIFISGCDNYRAERDALASRNAKLEQLIAAGYDKRQAEMDYHDRAAVITQACGAVVDLCPESMTATGKAAIAAGYTGGGFLFWALVLVKFSVVIAAGGMVAFIVIFILAPTVKQQEEARKTISGAEKREREALAKVQRIEASIAGYYEKLREAHEAAAGADEQVEAAKHRAAKAQQQADEQIAALDKKIASRKAMLDAITGL